MKTLVSMIAFIRHQQKSIPIQKGVVRESWEDQFARTVINYSIFLERPLTLGMFVSCDENGNVLEEPESYQMYIPKLNYLENSWNIECKIYHEAKEKVLFKGFEVSQEKDGDSINLYLMHEDWGQTVMNKINDFAWESNFENVEELFLNHPEIELTKSAIKQIGL